MDKQKEYELLMQLELETTKTRHTTFTALLSISFVLPGLALETGTTPLHWMNFETDLSKLVFLLGYVFYCFSVFHYAWYHRYSHRYRAALKRLERELGANIYRRRVRPQHGKMKLHFDWALYIIAVVYGSVACAVTGWVLFCVVIGAIAGAYCVMLILSIWQSEEPLEQSD
jgi:hypothetical protein